MTFWLLDPSTTYLNHGSFGSCPRPVLEYQAELRMQMERDPIGFLLDRLEPALDEVRTAIGALVGAKPEDLALVTNATHAANAVFSSIELGAGDEIVALDHGYQAVNNAAQRWVERAGGTLVIARVPLPVEGPGVFVEAVKRALSARTKLVVVDHVTSPTALVLPVRAIVELCAERGVDVFVDGAHAPGMVDLDLDSLGAAYCTGNLHKWICAPKSVAYLHVRRDRRAHVRPLVTSHGAGLDREDRSKFHLEFDWTGTQDPTAALCVPRAIAELRGLHERGLAGVRQDNHALVVRARNLLCERLGFERLCPDDMLGAMASVKLPRGGPGSSVALHDELARKHRIQVPVFPWPSNDDRLLRVSAQRYNTLEDYEKLALALAEC